MPGCERNLVLVQTPNLQARSDFETVKAKLADWAPDIEVFIVNNDARQSVTRRQAAGRLPHFGALLHPDVEVAQDGVKLESAD